MGFLDRRALHLGWQPDVDAAAAPPGAFLRADNLTLEEQGVLALRRDSAVLFGPLADLDVHSLYTEVLNGVRHRLAGAGDTVYLNGTPLIAEVDGGGGDIAFGGHQGQILIARGSTRSKFDGSAIRNWGIAMTGGAPTATPGPPDGKTFVSGPASGVPAFVVTEDDGTGIAYQPNHAGIVDGAAVVVPSTKGRGTLTATLAAPHDFTVYDNLTEADDADSVSFYVFVTEPNNLASIDLLIDVNDGGFQTDYYLASFSTAQLSVVGPTDTQGVDFGTPPASPTPITAAVPGNLVSILLSVGWNKLQITRGQMQRVGATSGCDWTTVRAIRVTANAYTSDPIAFDTIRISGGRLTGQYQWCYVLAYNTGKYVALSAPSEASDVLTLSSSAASVLVPFDTDRDTQADEIWLFRIGGALAGFLRVAVQAIGPAASTPAIFSYTQFWEAQFLSDLEGFTDNGVANYVADFEGTEFGSTFPDGTQFGPGCYTNTFEQDAGEVVLIGMSPTRGVTTGAVAIDDTLSDVNALIEDLPLEADNGRPPVNIIDIEGPYYDRTYVLTSDGLLWPSRQLNPDSFATGQAIRISAADETALWVKKGPGGLYVGTTKDIYRLEGDGTELPDGSINFAKRPLNVDHPPISDGLAQEGNVLLYMANDGWRAFTGDGTQSIVGATSLLYRGYTRHGVPPINVTGGRFRAAIVKGQIVALAPEGVETGSTTVLYRRSSGGAWERHVYTARFLVVYAERDGTLLAGDTAGQIWQLDTPNLTGIPVTLWTPADDGDAPFSVKTPSDLHLTLDSGGAAVAVLALRDGQAAGGVTFTAATHGLDLAVVDISGLREFRQLQLQLTGTFTTFRYAGYGLTIVPRPVGVRRWDTGPIDVQKGELAWVRRVFVKARPSGPLTVAVFLDGAAQATKTVDAGGGQDLQVPIDFGRGLVGRQVRLVVTSTNPFLPYWVQIQLRSTGKGSEKPIVTVHAA